MRGRGKDETVRQALAQQPWGWQAGLASRLGVNPARVSEVLNGARRRGPLAQRIQREIAQVLSLPVERVFPNG
jgi:DNA-binding transcriptional regulator YdaS (Cro superfamily)